jgi:hypothetical protein
VSDFVDVYRQGYEVSVPCIVAVSELLEALGVVKSSRAANKIIKSGELRIGHSAENRVRVANTDALLVLCCAMKLYVGEEEYHVCPKGFC